MNGQLLEWYNLIFELPAALGLFYLALYCTSGWTFGDADHDIGAEGVFDHDVDAHLDVNGEVAVEHDADLSHELHSDADNDSGDSGEQGASGGLSILSALNWIGLGRMPLSLVLMIFMLCWGSIGFFAMRIQAGSPVGRSVMIAIVIAGAIGVTATHVVSSFLARTLFSTADISRRRHELLGSFGEAMYPIDSKFGMVIGRDDHGELFQVACVVAQGEGTIAKGSPVQLVAYTAKERMFCVVPANTSITPRRTMGTSK